MAHNDTEIEIKIPIDRQAKEKVKEKLNELGEYIKTINQVDRYFTPEHRNFLDPEYPYEWLRIRQRNDKIVLNYKHYYPENAENTTHCDEFETEVEERDQIEHIFSALDFEELTTIKKIRQVYEFEDKFEIALDKVKELGFFIEIEAIKDLGSVENTRKKLLNFADRLEIDTTNTDKRGYPYLKMKKKGLVE